MAENRQKLVHLHTSDVKVPSQGVLDLGEIAVQHNDVEAALYIEKNNGEIAKFIDATAVDAKVNTEKLRAEGAEDALSDRIDSLEGSNHTHDNKSVLDGITESKVAVWDAAEANASAYTESAIEALDLANTYESKGAAAEAIEALKLAETYEAKGAAAEAIEALDLANTYEAKGAAAEAIEALKLAETYEAKGAAAEAIEALDLANTYAKKEVESVINTLVGEDSGKSVRVVASEEVAKIVDSADTSYDTLKEIADWIINDTTGSAQMANDINALKAISADTRLVSLENVSHTHSNKELLDTYTQTEVNLADAVAKKHEHENKAVLDGITEVKVAAWDAAEANASAYTESAIEALDLANTYEAKGAAAEAIEALKLAETYEVKGAAAEAIEALDLANTYEAKGAAAEAIESLKLTETYEAKGAAQTAENNAKTYADEQIAKLRIDCGTY